MDKRIYILGGGTFSHVRNHMAIAAPAFGQTARKLNDMLVDWPGLRERFEPPRLVLTKMANHYSPIVTNEDVAAEASASAKSARTSSSSASRPPATSTRRSSTWPA